MTLDREKLPSIRYWTQSEQHVAQHFYISFCLLMSSVQDTFLGLLARKQKNLNWSATCSYYGLVHGGRLLAFLAFGDFPRSHSWLRNLWLGFGSGDTHRPYEYDCLPFTWLGDFAPSSLHNIQRSRRPGEQRPSRPSNQDCFDTAVNYYAGLGLSEMQHRLRKFGYLLRSAAELRNDSNYEALLIAHEYHHKFVSEAFENLSAKMCSAAQSMLPEFIEVFDSYVHQSKELALQRNAYQSFLYDYVNKRVVLALIEKLESNPSLIEELKKYAETIQTHNPNSDYSEIERLVSLDRFDRKVSLMDEFRRKVNNLDYAISET